MSSDKKFYVVGVGASAGGLEATQQFFNNVSSGSQAAFVVVQHLSPDFKSLMNELLAKYTDLPIVKLDGPTPVEPGHIYLMSSKQNIMLEGDTLQPIDHDPANKINLPIDLFFHSLGHARQDCAIGIVLSGTGTDGSRGIRTIHEQGGIVMAQSPETAKFDGMPRSAINSGVADYTLSIPKIAEEVNRLVDGNNAPLLPDKPEKLLTTEEDYLNEIIGEILERTKIDFSYYRQETILRRLGKRMSILDMPTIKDYYQYIEQVPEEAINLSKEFLIGVSQFFRDAEVWEDVAKEVIPVILAKKKNRDTIRVWVSGCSTGEEAYTLGILFLEAIQKAKLKVSIKIFATDVDNRGITHAGNGLYGEDITNVVPTEYIGKYFDHLGLGYRVKKEFREHFVFALHNFLSDPPFINMDMVSCRNALIYIQPEMQQKVMQSFQFSLRNEGILLLGKSENLGEMKAAFETINFRSKIFTSNPHYEHTIRQTGMPSPHSNPPLVDRRSQRPRQKLNYTDHDAYTDILAEQHAPDSIFVSATLEVLYIHGNADRYFSLPRRQVQLRLDRMLESEPAILMQSGVEKAIKGGKTIVYEDVVLQENEKVSIRFSRIVSIDAKEPLVLVEFLNPKKEEGANWESIRFDDLAQERIKQLEDRSRVRERDINELQEQLEIGSEELQASNEELLSSNEELQSSNEELQSLNEELYTVNTELQEKVEELMLKNNDIDNLLKSTRIATLFLDQYHRIRMFTPAIAEVIPISQSDQGRAIDHFSINLVDVNLLQYIQKVSDDGQSIEQEVATRNKKRFLLRIFPYLKSDDTVDGLVITFVDLTEIKQARQAVKDAKNYAESIVKSVKDPLVVLNAQHEVVSANPAYYEKFMMRPEDTVQQSVYAVNDAQWDTEELRHLLNEVIPHNAVVNDYVMQANFSQLGFRVMQLNAVRVSQASDLPELILLSIRDITEKELAEQKVRDTAERLDLVLQSSQTGIWEWDLETNLVIGNQRWNEIFELDTNQKLLVDKVLDRIHPDDLPAIQEAIQQAIEHHQFYHEDFRVVDAQGGITYVNGQGSVIRDHQGKPIKMLGTNVDITRRKENELSLQATNRQLKIANEYLDDFVFMAAHDLRSPVANLRALAELWHAGTHNDMVVDKVERSVERLDDTLNGLIQILNIQQYEQKKLVEIRFDHVFKKLTADMEPTIQAAHASLRTDFAVESVYYVEPFLESILRNLISNALKYRHPERPLEITVSTHPHPNYVSLRVKDNGQGIDIQRGHNKLFKAFERLTLQGEGKGIGMHLVKNMVEKNGGHIIVSSAPDQGSTFNLYLKPYHSNE